MQFVFISAVALPVSCVLYCGQQSVATACQYQQSEGRELDRVERKTAHESVVRGPTEHSQYITATLNKQRQAEWSEMTVTIKLVHNTILVLAKGCFLKMQFVTLGWRLELCTPQSLTTPIIAPCMFTLHMPIHLVNKTELEVYPSHAIHSTLQLLTISKGAIFYLCMYAHT